MPAVVPEDAVIIDEDIADLIRRISQEVLDDFHASETFSSQQSLEHLACSHPSFALDFGLPTHGDVQELPQVDGTDLRVGGISIIHSFDDEGSPTQDIFDAHAQSSAEDYFEDYPLYESCLPRSINLVVGDDSDDVPFVPYADDDDFDCEGYMDEHRGVSWQGPQMNLPHVTWTTLETGRRLVEEYSLDLVEIDETGILPVPLLSTSDDWGAIVRSRNTDCPPAFQEKAGSYQRLSDVSPPEMHDLSTRVQTGLSIFCSNLNCIQAYCSTHDSRTHLLDEDDRYVAHAGHHLPPPVTHPCGSTCYLLINIPEQNKSGKRKRNGLKPQDVENLKLLFKISPEATSCDIAQVMQYRCYEVHVQRLEYHRSTRSHSRLETSRELAALRSEATETTAPTPQSPPSNEISLKRFEPCSHKGPCGPSAMNCTCCDSSIPCERNCCCTSDCPRRFPGCDCARLRPKSQKKSGPKEFHEPEPDLCIDHDCPCQKNRRECDPELCDCFHYSCPEEACREVECKNSDLRRERGKQLRVAPGFSGLGVFLEEPTQKGELICEYVGELTYEATTETRDMLAQHRGRAYVYKLNDALDVDASYAGNTARFINHASDRRANCVTIIKNVSGDHRIGIYAKKSMVSGAELTIDYGEDFFKPVKDKESTLSSRTLTPSTSGQSPGKSRSSSRSTS